MKQWFLLAVLACMSLVSYASPLPASEVFQVETKPIDPNTFTIKWQVKPGYFLYSDRIKLSQPSDSNVHLGTIRFPKTLTKVDKQGHVFTVYRDQLRLSVPVLGEHPGESLVDLSFQGCSDEGFCYPPETKQIKLTIDKDLALNEVSLETEPSSPTTAPEVANKEVVNNEVAEVFANHHWTFVMMSFWVFGLLLAFTPCILPMVPVLSGIIVGHGETLSTRKAFLLSLAYVLSMSATYALVGAVVAELGSNLQVVMQAPLAIGLFSFVFVLLALSMFGFYELRLPVAWQTKLARANRSQGSGHYISAAVMGCLSTLILSPCITAPLIGALGFIAQSGNIALGSSALFFLGLGIGTPLLLIGTSAGKWLPKAGKWMNAVKAFFGVLLLALALTLLERILPKPLVMALWAALLVFLGIYCGALRSSSTARAKFGQGLGIMLLLWGLLILIGASMGNTNPLQPLAGTERLDSTHSQSIQTVKSLNALNQALVKAKGKGKPVLLDFYADWCHSCQVMKSTVFKDPQILKALKSLVVLNVDVTANSKQEKELLNQFNVVAPPTFVFINKQGLEQHHLRLVGETSKNKFLEQLMQVKNSNHES